jgi:ABC-type polysaccharide/polyol phosphate export permease
MEQVPAGIKNYFIFNPIGELIYMETSVILGNGQVDTSALGITTLLSIGIFLLGLLVFHKLEPAFAEVM